MQCTEGCTNCPTSPDLCQTCDSGYTNTSDGGCARCSDPHCSVSLPPHIIHALALPLGLLARGSRTGWPWPSARFTLLASRQPLPCLLQLACRLPAADADV